MGAAPKLGCTGLRDLGWENRGIFPPQSQQPSLRCSEATLKICRFLSYEQADTQTDLESVFMHPPACIGEGGNMKSGCVVMVLPLSVCLSDVSVCDSATL